MKIGVTGATGQLGRLVVAALKQLVNSDKLIVLVRSVEKATDLNIEARTFDYNNADPKALAGIDTLLLISGSEIGQRERQHSNVINAALKAGVKRIVYTSLLHANTSTLSLAAEHKATERDLKNSGIDHTILRNGWYTENYTGSLNNAIASGAIVGCAGDGKIASATRADYAQAAAVVLTSDGHSGKTYELSGDSSYTLAELAEEVSKQTGKKIEYKNMTEYEYANLLAGIGLPEGLAQAIAGWDTSASKGDLYDDSHQLSTIIGRQTTPLSVMVKSALQAI